MDILDIANFIKWDYAQNTAPTWAYGSVQTSLLQRPHEALVIFRGTEGLTGVDGWLDWARNLRSMPWYDADLQGWAAAGFLKGVRHCLAADDHAMARSLTRMSSRRKLYFGGHSKGGAEIIICAALCAARGLCVPDVLAVFGSARPGHFKLPPSITTLALRNRRDPVPYVAPWQGAVIEPTWVGPAGRLTPDVHGIDEYIKHI